MDLSYCPDAVCVAANASSEIWVVASAKRMVADVACLDAVAIEADAVGDLSVTAEFASAVSVCVLF